MYAYASVCDFVCIALLLHFVLGICLSVFVFVLFFSIDLSTCYHWWICFLVWLLSSFFLSFFYIFIFLFLIFISYFNNIYFILFFFLFFLPFILSHVDDRVLVLQWGIRAVPLRWESQVQDIGPQRPTSSM